MKKRKVIIALVAFILVLGGVFQSGKVKAQQLPYTGVEGRMYKNLNDGAYFWYLLGKYHYVESPLTLSGLFDNRLDISTITFTVLPPQSPGNSPFGTSLGPNNGLLRDTNDGKVYFLRDGYIHHITTPDILDRYLFRTKSIRNITGIGGYILCEPLSSSPVFPSPVPNPCTWP